MDQSRIWNWPFWSREKTFCHGWLPSPPLIKRPWASAAINHWFPPFFRSLHSLPGQSEIFGSDLEIFPLLFFLYLHFLFHFPRGYFSWKQVSLQLRRKTTKTRCDMLWDDAEESNIRREQWDWDSGRVMYYIIVQVNFFTEIILVLWGGKKSKQIIPCSLPDSLPSLHSMFKPDYKHMCPVSGTDDKKETKLFISYF